ncbi:MAG: hypothetical protein QOF78_3289 [Phycisphaerales bacterium]|nr:hypothetical protein [Phycisphaerales bacterium]
MRFRFPIPSIVLTFFMTLSLAAAAPPAPPPTPAQPPGGASGSISGSGSDPLRFRHLTMTALREKLALDDAQWKSLWPKIEKVLEAQRNARTGAAMSFSSAPMIKGTPPPNVAAALQRQSAAAAPATVESPAGRAMQQLRAALDKDESDADLLTHLAAMRAARDAARAELAAAQKDLHAACTPRQEAVLVTFGVLE